MAYTYLGDAILGVSLSVETPKPLDARTVVDVTKDLYSIPTNQAYRGMTVSNLEDGNIYMLIDKNKINKSEGWKSSQSALLIISCTQQEYDKWVANTDSKYNPIDPNELYISLGVYYYIQEEENGVYYLTSIWGKNIEELLSKKASNDGLISLLDNVKKLADNLANNYTTTETMLVSYVTNTALLEQLNTKFEVLADYYTKKETDDTFVKKSDLGEGGLEGDDFIFVTSKQYVEDLAALRKELDQTLKLDGEGSLESITVGQIKSPIVENKELLTVNVTPEGLIINGDRLAGKSEIPVIISMSKAEYDKAVEEDTIDEEAYYYVYNTDEDLVYVTNKDLIASYHNIGQYQTWVAGFAYKKAEIDSIVATLQGKGDYVLLNQLNDYYTKTEADDIFLTKEDAADIYATGDDLTLLSSNIETTYVRKSDLRPDPENPGDDDDFIFVTLKLYLDDQNAMADAFETKVLTTNEVVVNSEVTLTTEEKRLVHNGEKVALVKDVHKVECMTELEYQDLIANKEIKEDTYYYTYEENNKAPTGYVLLDYIEFNYYNKRTIDEFLGLVDTNTSELISSELDKIRESIDGLVTNEEVEVSILNAIKNLEITDSYAKDEVYNKLEIDANYALKSEIPIIPTKLSAFENDNKYVTSTEVENTIATLIDAAPETLNTLNELATALGNDPNFATTVSSEIGKVSSEVNVLSTRITSLNDRIDTINIPVNISEFTNDANYLVENDVKHFATTSSVNDALITKVDKVDNMVLISSDNATKLDNLPTLEEYNNTIQSLQESINTNNDSILELQSNKVDVVSGKGLSTNDYTNDDKNALSDLLKRVAELEEAVTKLTAINTFNVKLDS